MVTVDIVKPKGRLKAQVGWLGLRVGSCLALRPHSLTELSELLQWQSHGDSTININIVIIITVLMTTSPSIMKSFSMLSHTSSPNN